MVGPKIFRPAIQPFLLAVAGSARRRQIGGIVGPSRAHRLDVMTDDAAAAWTRADNTGPTIAFVDLLSQKLPFDGLHPITALRPPSQPEVRLFAPSFECLTNFVPHFQWDRWHFSAAIPSRLASLLALTGWALSQVRGPQPFARFLASFDSSLRRWTVGSLPGPHQHTRLVVSYKASRPALLVNGSEQRTATAGAWHGCNWRARRFYARPSLANALRSFSYGLRPLDPTSPSENHRLRMMFPDKAPSLWKFSAASTFTQIHGAILNRHAWRTI